MSSRETGRSRGVRNSLRSVVLKLGRVMPYAFTRALTGSGPPVVPAYHVVSDEDVVHVKHLYFYKDERQFKNDIDFLLKHHAPITAGELKKAVANSRETKGKRSILFTFDDGLRENYEVIAPILKSKGVPAIFFLTVRCLDNRELFFRHKASIILEELRNSGISAATRSLVVKTLDRYGIAVNKSIKEGVLLVDYADRGVLDELAGILDIDYERYLAEERPYLTGEQVELLLRDGFDIGAHSLDHPRYETISLDEQVHQTIASVQQLQDTFGVNSAYFAFPFNDNGVPAALFERVAHAVDLSFGTSGFALDEYDWNIQRIVMDSDCSAKQMMWLTSLLHSYKSLKGGNYLRR